MKNALLKKLQKEVELFEGQKDSLEYKDCVSLLERVQKADTTILEEKLEKFEQQGASCWLAVWGRDGKFRIYGNAKYPNGFKPNFNPNFVEI